jgi:hypothetical protein
VGLEWFGGDPNLYVAERDVYPHATTAPQRIAVTTPPLPAGTTALTVCIQLPEINPATQIDVTVSGASLTRVR